MLLFPQKKKQHQVNPAQKLFPSRISLLFLPKTSIIRRANVLKAGIFLIAENSRRSASGFPNSGIIFIRKQFYKHTSDNNLLAYLPHKFPAKAVQNNYRS